MSITTRQLTQIEKRLKALEAEGEIRRVVARYMELCDALGPRSPMSELGDLFCREAVWVGSGRKYGKSFGEHHGRSAIVDFLKSYCEPPHFKSNVHFLTSESLRIRGDAAKGKWVMLQTPDFSNGESFVLAARLTLAFSREEGKWRISRFQTTNLLGRPVEGGWHGKAPIPVPAKSATKKRPYEPAD